MYFLIFVNFFSCKPITTARITSNSCLSISLIDQALPLENFNSFTLRGIKDGTYYVMHDKLKIIVCSSYYSCYLSWIEVLYPFLSYYMTFMSLWNWKSSLKKKKKTMWIIDWIELKIIIICGHICISAKKKISKIN